jgi:hypothetical protein
VMFGIMNILEIFPLSGEYPPGPTVTPSIASGRMKTRTSVLSWCPPYQEKRPLPVSPRDFSLKFSHRNLISPAEKKYVAFYRLRIAYPARVSTGLFRLFSAMDPLSPTAERDGNSEPATCLLRCHSPSGPREWKS